MAIRARGGRHSFARLYRARAPITYPFFSPTTDVAAGFPDVVFGDGGPEHASVGQLREVRGQRADVPTAQYSHRLGLRRLWGIRCRKGSGAAIIRNSPFYGADGLPSVAMQANTREFAAVSETSVVSQLGRVGSAIRTSGVSIAEHVHDAR